MTITDDYDFNTTITFIDIIDKNSGDELLEILKEEKV